VKVAGTHVATVLVFGCDISEIGGAIFAVLQVGEQVCIMYGILYCKFRLHTLHTKMKKKEFKL
jgi:hypothetical protein